MKTPKQIIAAAQITKHVSDQAKKNGFKSGVIKTVKESIDLFITILKS